MSNGFIPNSYQTPNMFVDRFLWLLTPEEWTCLSYAMRRIFGFEKRQDRISLSQFADGTKARDGSHYDHGTGLSVSAVGTAVKALVTYGLLLEVATPNDGRTSQDGTCYALQMDPAKVNETGLIARREAADQTNQDRAAKAREARAAKRAGVQPSVGQNTSEGDTSLLSDSSLGFCGTEVQGSVGQKHMYPGKPGNPPPPTPTPSTDETPTVPDRPVAPVGAGGGGRDKKPETTDPAARKADAYLRDVCDVKAPARRKQHLADGWTKPTLEVEYSRWRQANAKRPARDQLGGGAFSDSLIGRSPQPAQTPVAKPAYLPTDDTERWRAMSVEARETWHRRYRAQYEQWKAQQPPQMAA